MAFFISKILSPEITGILFFPVIRYINHSIRVPSCKKICSLHCRNKPFNQRICYRSSKPVNN
ncbi:MAG: SET domain-containing protein-lysine N-methyltransferase [Actinobacteria bacterium]|nr:SET domain-containing protein-lysine N-methyltransferase [Actinomycetota bacterium]